MRIFRKRRPISNHVTIVSSGLTLSEDAVNPLDGDRQDMMAVAAAHMAAGEHADALALIDGALEAHSDDAVLTVAKASALFGWGRYAEARDALIRARKAGVRCAAFHTKLGWSYFWLGQLHEAAESMAEAVAEQPADWAPHFGLATVLRAQHRVDESRVAFERALELDPRNLHCLSSLVAIEVDLGRSERAEEYARRALALDSGRAAAWSDLGVVLDSQGRYTEAIESHRYAVELGLAPDEASDALVNYAICLLRTGRADDAIALIEPNLNRHPSSLLHSQYALALLIAGRLPEGWTQYEFRWIDPPLLSGRPNFVKPVWTGQDLQGKTILLRTEQGLGDFIQFIRYAPHVKALGARVLLQPREEMRELAERLVGIDEILKPNEPYPEFDFYVNLLSLPRVFGTSLTSIPAEVPYLDIDPARNANWRKRFDRSAALNVGLVWAGSPTHLRDRFRSLPLTALAPFAQLHGVRFHSLQKGPASAELAAQPNFPLVDLGPELHSFADTAAAICNLDLVIGVDTAVIHLAGALGKPVWSLLPIPSDWRWLEHRDDTPWYPTMRLFRQRCQGEWTDVIERVKSALESLVENHASSLGVRPSADIVVPPCTHLKPAPDRGIQASDQSCRVAETRMGIMQYFPDQPCIGRSLECYGEYLQPQLDLLSRYIVPGSWVLERGAGVGAHSLFLASVIGTSGHLFLCEDDKTSRRVLRQNLNANRVSNSTLLKVLPASPPASKSVPESIDRLRLERLDWIKLDEGVTPIIELEGAQETIWRLRPKLFIAAHDGDECNALVARARELGYRCWRIETPLFNPANFNRREMDIFSGKSAAALLAVPEEADFEVASVAKPVSLA